MYIVAVPPVGTKLSFDRGFKSNKNDCRSQERSCKQGDELDNVLNENELITYKLSDVYQVEKVLKTRMRKGKKEAFVKWLHYDDKFNSWIPFKDLKSID